VGRRTELAHVVGLLDATRMLTLAGPGGAGKTWLAEQAALSLVADRDGVFVAELSRVASGSEVPSSARASCSTRRSRSRTGWVRRST
jgi:predicted ATPase